MGKIKPYHVVADEGEFLVVYKKPGVLVHGRGANDHEASADQTQVQQNLIDALRADFDDDIYPCHRLDRDTSGLMLIAKGKCANSTLSQAFEQRLVKKSYLAIIDRRPKKKQGMVKGDMLKSRNGCWRLSRSDNKPAITQFKSVGLGDGKRVVMLNPVTGKTHQLRVALKSLGSPILGDVRYGGMASDRLYLHSYELKFIYRGTEFQFDSPAHEGEHFLEIFQARKLEEIFNIESGSHTN